MHILTTTRRSKDKIYQYYFLAESYWDKEKKQPRNRVIANLSSLPKRFIELIRKYLRSGQLVAKEEIEAEKASDYGIPSVFFGLSQNTALSAILRKYLGKDSERVLSMVINRLADPKAKYALSDWLETTALPELLDKPLSFFHYNRCYEALDKLFVFQDRIEDELEKKGNTGNHTLLLYDLTSSYFEGGGEKNSLSSFGYNRDGKKGKKQIIIGLVTDEHGKPLSIEVLPGNTADKKVLKERINQLKRRFKVEKVILVFDRGMATIPNKQTLKEAGVDYLTALTPTQIRKLAKKNTPLQLGLFDKKHLFEITINTATDEEPLFERLILCRSEEKKIKDRKQTECLLTKTEEKLGEIQNLVKKGKLKDEVKIAKRVGRWINRYGMEDYFITEISRAHFSFTPNQERIKEQELLFGMYVLVTSTTKEQLKAEEAQTAYKSLSQVEEDFRVLKSSLKIRPIFHWKETRIKAHVFVCFLALWLTYHFEERLKPLFKEGYTRSQIETELVKLKSLRLIPREIFNHPILTRITKLQERIFQHLRFPIPLLATKS